ncbi:unnamed protein product, partial [Mesorhabditis belari]|uniref:Uncharacterized protein n=1 Tax=Mesorhabditis belari TaxID=2138241 RepID=A0AAF3FBZ5_9BILA
MICCVSILYFSAQFVTPDNVKQLSLSVRQAAAMRSVVTMDGLIWVVLSWSLVGGLCYYALNKLGITNNGQNVEARKNGHTTASSSGSTSNGANCDWANDLIYWLYGNLRRVPGPLDAWIKSLNDAAKKVTNPSKCEILFEGFGDHSAVHEGPQLRNVRVQQGPRDHLTLRTDVHIPQMRLKLVSSQRNVQTMVVTNYDVDILDLRGEIETRVACIAGQLYVMGCFSGRPEMDVQLKNTDTRATMEVDRGLVEDAIRRCLVSAVTNVNLSDGSASMRNSTDMSPPEPYKRLSAQGLASSNNYTSVANPRLSRSPQTSFNASFEGKPVDDFLTKKLNNNQTMTPNVNVVNAPNKLKINVIKGSKLGKDIDVLHPYVVIETDEPPQRFQTTKGINANPYWEEQFDFELNPATEEMLFEVYEGKQNKSPSHDDVFLGLAIVNLEEIQRSSDSMHVLNLQGRPYRNDAVQGQLTCQFEYYYDPNVRAVGRVSDTVIVKDQNGGEFRESITTQRRVVYDPHDNFDEVIPTKTTTVTVKTVTQSLKDKPAIQSVHGSMENAMDPIIQRQLDDRLRERHIEPPVMSLSGYSHESALSNGSNDPPRATSTIPPITAVDDRQSRDRSKKMKEPKEKRDRSFFGAMKDRLSGRRSKSAKRSQSFDLESPVVQEAVSLPASRDASRVRYDSEGHYVETASLGGKSGESTRSLYQHSTLVLELNHKGEKKYFLIPPSLLAEPAAAKLMKRGKKLHIYNEHTFVAVKCRSNIDCNVCHQRIGRSFSKQAYQCRDCKMVSHKSCHYKSDAFCTHSNVARLPIVKDVDWNHFLSNHQLEEFISMEGV